jgi:hypothetical protein
MAFRTTSIPRKTLMALQFTTNMIVKVHRQQSTKGQVSI